MCLWRDSHWATQTLPSGPRASPVAGLGPKAELSEWAACKTSLPGWGVILEEKETGEIGCLCPGVLKIWRLSRAQAHWPLHHYATCGEGEGWGKTGAARGFTCLPLKSRRAWASCYAWYSREADVTLCSFFSKESLETCNHRFSACNKPQTWHQTGA